MSGGPATGSEDHAPLERLQQSLQHVDALPVGDRVEVFEQVNDAIARELARLDEV